MYARSMVWFQDNNGSIENEELRGFLKDLLELVKKVSLWYLIFLFNVTYIYVTLKVVTGYLILTGLAPNFSFIL